MAEFTTEIEMRTSLVRLRPGEVYVLESRVPLDDASYRRLVESANELSPDVHFVVLDNTVRLARESVDAVELRDALRHALAVLTAPRARSEEEAIDQASAHEEAILAARKALGMGEGAVS